MTSPRGGSPIDSSSSEPPRLLLVLASESPRRKALLESARLHPDVTRPANLDETPLKDELPRQCAQRLSREKARAVAETWPGDPALILAADTIVACGRRMLPKATSAEDVRHCLRLLNGRSHQVITGVAVIMPGGRLRARTVTSRVSFARLENSAIEHYVATGEGIGKAGGYAVQGRVEAFTRHINGSYSNVVGLPLFETVQLLKGCGYPVP
jgi:septum formation protein